MPKYYEISEVAAKRAKDMIRLQARFGYKRLPPDGG